MTTPPDDRQTAINRVAYAIGRRRHPSDPRLTEVDVNLAEAATIAYEPTLRAAREDGRRQGAREMREAAERRAGHCMISYAGIHDYESEAKQIANARRDISGAIYALPLPGDAPAK